LGFAIDKGLYQETRFIDGPLAFKCANAQISLSALVSGPRVVPIFLPSVAQRAERRVGLGAKIALCSISRIKGISRGSLICAKKKSNHWRALRGIKTIGCAKYRRRVSGFQTHDGLGTESA